MKHIPNALTLSNLLFGCLSIFFSFNQNLEMAGYCIIFGAIADFLDGFVARALKVSGELGAQLDSLSDMVTFGVAPGFIALQLISPTHDFWLIAFIIPLCAAIRLAKFNIAEASQNFTGIPSPACGMFWAATAIGGISFIPEEWQSWFILLCILTTALLMVAPLEIISFKFKNLKWAGNQMRYLFIVLSIATILIFRWASAPIILVLYLVCSLANRFTLTE